MDRNEKILDMLNKNTNLDFIIDDSIPRSVYFESKHVIISNYDSNDIFYVRNYHSYEKVEMLEFDYDVINEIAKKGMLLQIEKLKKQILEIESDMKKL